MRFVGLLGVVGGVAACYQPSASSGAPCGPDGACPSGLVCHANRCVAPGAFSDDAPPTPEDAAPDTSSAAMDAAPDAPPASGPWKTPVEVPSLNAVSGQDEDDPSFTANRLTVVLTSNSPEDLYECTRASLAAAFSCSAIGVLNSTSVESSPEISATGTTLYFVSDRSGIHQAYTSTKTNGVWSAPTVVPELSLNSVEDLAISPDGLTAVVAQDLAVNHIRVLTRATTTAPFSNPVLHSELEVTDDITAPTITNGGALIYFHAGAPRDIYVATRQGNGTYTTPVPVTELNTANRDAAPFVSADDTYMMFERAGDIFETSRQ